MIKDDSKKEEKISFKLPFYCLLKGAFNKAFLTVSKIFVITFRCYLLSLVEEPCKYGDVN